jgi:DNA-binding GntR family transcriptional regulator
MILRPQGCANMVCMIDHGSVTPLYVQLADLIAEKIERGEYAAGQRLPSADDLAELHGIAPNTARKALSLLRERGLAEMSAGRGTYVTRR